MAEPAAAEDPEAELEAGEDEEEEIVADEDSAPEVRAIIADAGAAAEPRLSACRSQLAFSLHGASSVQAMPATYAALLCAACNDVLVLQHKVFLIHDVLHTELVGAGAACSPGS